MNMPNMTAKQSALSVAIQAAILDLVEIGKAMGTQDGLDQRHAAAFDRVEELARQIPSPARSETDFVMRAQVAWALADKGRAAAAARHQLADANSPVRVHGGSSCDRPQVA